MTAFKHSLCDTVRVCVPYEHKHCCRCEKTLMARGEGPVYSDDGPTVDGYEDAHVCTGCDDDFYLLCSECFTKNPQCEGCEYEAAVV